MTIKKSFTNTEAPDEGERYNNTILRDLTHHYTLTYQKSSQYLKS
jgi:hypothetical protein